VERFDTPTVDNEPSRCYDKRVLGCTWVATPGPAACCRQ